MAPRTWAGDGTELLDLRARGGTELLDLRARGGTELLLRARGGAGLTWSH